MLCAESAQQRVRYLGIEGPALANGGIPVPVPNHNLHFASWSMAGQSQFLARVLLAQIVQLCKLWLA
jgi:hypothetical protein